MSVPITMVGKIIFGEERGRYVKIIDDGDNTGGYLILTASSPDFSDGYDNWVENHEALTGYFEESRWIVDWS